MPIPIPVMASFFQQCQFWYRACPIPVQAFWYCYMPVPVTFISANHAKTSTGIFFIPILVLILSFSVPIPVWSYISWPFSSFLPCFWICHHNGRPGLIFLCQKACAKSYDTRYWSRVEIPTWKQFFSLIFVRIHTHEFIQLLYKLYSTNSYTVWFLYQFIQFFYKLYSTNSYKVVSLTALTVRVHPAAPTRSDLSVPRRHAPNHMTSGTEWVWVFIYTKLN